MRLKLGLVVVGAASWGGEHFRPFSPYNTLCSPERWQAATSSLLFVFFDTPPPPFTSPFSILLFFLVLLSTFPPSFLSIPTLLPIVIICALPGAESTHLLLVMTQSRRLLSGIITEIFPFSLFLSVSVEAIETIIRGLQ